jgi:hypothetical protein
MKRGKKCKEGVPADELLEDLGGEVGGHDVELVVDVVVEDGELAQDLGRELLLRLAEDVLELGRDEKVHLGQKLKERGNILKT